MNENHNTSLISNRLVSEGLVADNQNQGWVVPIKIVNTSNTRVDMNYVYLWV